MGPGVAPKDCNQINSLYNFDIMIRGGKKVQSEVIGA